MASLVLGTLGLLTVGAIPTTIGVGQAISAQKRENAARKEQEKFHLTALLPGDEEAFCVLVNGKIFVDHPTEPVPGHRFCGYYFTYPGEEGHRGLVSTIAEDPPMLNWIFVSAETRELRFAGRKETIGHVIGPWGWTADERFLILEGSQEGFIAVREERQEEGEEGSTTRRWAVYWDPDGQLRGRMDPDSCVDVLLRRRPLLGMESRYVKK